jgi:hypothetical protein
MIWLVTFLIVVMLYHEWALRELMDVVKELQQWELERQEAVNGLVGAEPLAPTDTDKSAPKPNLKKG